MDIQDIRRVGRFIAYKVDVKTGHWCRRTDSPEYRKKWVLVDDGGLRQSFPVKKGFMEASVHNYEECGWWKLPKQESVDKCARIRKGKLSITELEAAEGLFRLLEGEPSDKYRAPWFATVLGYQRPMVC